MKSPIFTEAVPLLLDGLARSFCVEFLCVSRALLPAACSSRWTALLSLSVLFVDFSKPKFFLSDFPAKIPGKVRAGCQVRPGVPGLFLDAALGGVAQPELYGESYRGYRDNTRNRGLCLVYVPTMIGAGHVVRWCSSFCSSARIIHCTVCVGCIGLPVMVVLVLPSWSCWSSLSWL